MVAFRNRLPFAPIARASEGSGTGTGAYTWGGSASGTGTSKTVTFSSSGTVTVFRAGDPTYAASNTATASVTVNPADTTAPSIPTGLAASAVTSTSFTLSWTASTDNVSVTGYEVFKGGVSQGTVSTTSMNLTGLTSGTTYSVTVRAGDAANNWSAQSTALSVTTLAAPTITTQPTSQTVATGASATFTVAATGTAPTYQWRKNAVNLANGGNVSGATAATLTLTNAQAADAASYTVVVTNSAGSATSAAATLTVTADATAPTVPTGLAASAITTTSFTLTWSASTDTGAGVALYEVFKGGVSQGTTAATSFAVSGLTPGTSYSLTVRASDGGNWSAQSTALAVTTAVDNAASDTIAPSAPPNLQASSLTESGFTLTWGAAADNVGVTGYEVRLNEGLPVAAVGLSRTFTGLAPATSFSVQVRALDAADNASAWAGAWVTTGGASTGTGTAQSIWFDVTGDGIRDELVQAGTADFNYSINTWVMISAVYTGTPLNFFWFPQSVTGFGEIGTGFSFAWLPTDNFWINFQTVLSLDFTVRAEANRRMFIYRDASGSADLNPANWQLFQTLEFTASGLQTILVDEVTPPWLVGSKFFLVKEELPIGSMRIRDSFGNIILDNLMANNPDLFLPRDGKTTLTGLNTAGKVIGAAHSFAWKIFDSIGNLLREGLGWDIDFDNIRGQVQFVFVLDNAPAPPVSLNIATLELNFANSKMSSTKVIDPLPSPLDHRIGVLVGDTIVFSANAITANTPLSGADYQWSGIKIGQGTTLSVAFDSEGNHSEVLQVRNISRQARVTAMTVPIFGEEVWLLAHPERVSSAFSLREEAVTWSVTNQQLLGGGAGNGREDAARHAYWNAITTVDWNAEDAEGFTSAHESSNIAAGGAHNETVMDLENNLRGRIIASGSDPSRPALANGVITALNAGLLTILDDLTNGNEVGLLRRSSP